VAKAPVAPIAITEVRTIERTILWERLVVRIILGTFLGQICL